MISVNFFIEVFVEENIEIILLRLKKFSSLSLVNVILIIDIDFDSCQFVGVIFVILFVSLKV